MSCLIAVAGLAVLSCSQIVENTRPVSASGMHLTAEAFALPHLFEVTLPAPDRWEAVTNARRFEYAPPAVLLLFSKRSPAIIRFHVFDSAMATSGEIIFEFIDQLEKTGCRWLPSGISDERDGPVSIVFYCSSGQPPAKGKILVERIPGNTKTSVVAIGLWQPADDARMIADFDVIVGSLKMPSK
jgi:hypothetical protein